MTEQTPEFVGMPELIRTFSTKYGEIICGGPCRDDYGRIVWFTNGAGENLKLQKAARDSFLAAEDAAGGSIPITGAWRSCTLQTGLYNSDHNRYAEPKTTAHCRGLAIDVRNDLSSTRANRIRRALENHGWHQARPDDEPWHYSYAIKV